MADIRDVVNRDSSVNPGSLRNRGDLLVRPSRIALAKFLVPVGQRSPEDQVEIYQKVVDSSLEQIPTLAALKKLRSPDAPVPAKESAPALREQLSKYYEKVFPLIDDLEAALDIPVDDADLLRVRLDQSQQSFSKTQQQLDDAEQQNEKLQRTLGDRDKTLSDQQLQITLLQQRNADLEKRLAELEQRTAIEPTGFGVALGQAVDAIQEGLTALKNPYIDYGLQEFDLQTQVNLQVNDQGRLLIRFPGIGEEIAAQNLSQLNMRLRPIPKGQQNQLSND